MRTLGSHLFRLALVLQCVLKLWLIQQHEIGVCDYPNDDPWYLTAATHWYWGGSFADGAFLRSPAYPLWIALSRFSGLPLRLATELLLIAAAAAVAFALVRAQLHQLVAAIVFGIIIFHPFSVYVNDAVLSESLYAPLLLLSLAGMIRLLTEGRHRLVALGTGLLLGVMWHTRQEYALLAPQLALFALVAVWIRAAAGHPRRVAVRDVAATVLVIAGAGLGVVFAVRLANAVTFGAFADREFDMPGFAAAQNALLRIQAERPMRWVGVPQESLRRAYAVSPSLRQLQPYLDGPERARWVAAAPPAVAERNEVGGRLGWMIDAAIHSAGYGTSVKDTESFAQGIADEINAACAAGRLKCRSGFLGSLTGIPDWLRQVPASAVTVAKLLIWRGPNFGPRCRWAAVNQSTIDLFDLATNRRTGLVTTGLHLSGWAVHVVDPVRAIGFRAASGQLVAFTDRLEPRADLDAAFRHERAPEAGPVRAAFALRIPVPAGTELAGALTFTLESGERVEIPAEYVRTVPLRRREGAGGGHFSYAIEYRARIDSRSGGAQRGLSSMFQLYGLGVVALTVAGAVAALRLLSSRTRRRQSPVIAGVAVLLLGVTATRLVLLAVFDATSWPVEDPRFVYPVAALYPCALLVLVACAFLFSRDARRTG